ncbi:MAG: cation diffusion facilitator family transporter, partial [Endomicrobiaceae bacterium]|nr:cation diffusion facilitator family transporter [Endomicrobiaceae bacterium]
MENKKHHNEHNHNQSHVHAHTSLSGSKYLGVILLNICITIAEIIGGIMSGSLSLLSDAVHNFSDTVSIIFSYFAWKISGKKKDAKRTYGYKRAEIIAAFVNSSVLVIISLFLIFEAIKRFQNPETINSIIMIGVAIVGLLANFISMLLLEKESHHNMNIKSSYLHLLGDTLSSVGVVLGGIAIFIWNIFWIDPVITLMIAVYIMIESWKIVKKSVDILMQSSAELDYTAIKQDIENFDEVRNIHHVHTWMSNENTIYFEAHIDITDCLLSQTCFVTDKIEKLLKEKYKIDHVTLQIETDRCSEKDFFKK